MHSDDRWTEKRNLSDCPERIFTVPPYYVGGCTSNLVNHCTTVNSSLQFRKKVVNFFSEVYHTIRKRAFESYEQQGKQDGHELDDWLDAEREVLESVAKAA
jgi:Protein of unknown function (DUF2934)